MKKFEFSKFISAIVITISTGISIWSIIKYYSLIELAIESNNNYITPNASLPIAAIGTILGTILSYCLYQFGLKNSRNKYGVDAEGNPLINIICNNESTDDLDEFPEQTPKDCEYTE